MSIKVVFQDQLPDFSWGSGGVVTCIADPSMAVNGFLTR